jgi:DNA modification methylase
MDSKLINGDCLEELKELGDNTVDLICSDPPYGLSFMGKKWDSFNEVISFEGESHVYAKKGFKKLPRNKPIAMEEFFVPIWKECLRVLKPGGFAFIMAAPKQDVLQKQIEALNISGFKTNFTSIYWAYATGFPKAMNVGKKSEKENLEGSYAGYQPKPAVEIVIVAMKPLEKKGYLDQALDNQKGVTWLDDARIPFAGMSDIEQYEFDRKGFTERSSIEEGEVYSEAYDNPSQKWGYKKPISKDLEKYNKDNVGAQKNFDTEPEGLSRGNQPSRNSKSDTYERVSAFGDSEQSETKDGRNLWGKKSTKKVKITKRQPRTDHNVFKQSGFKSEDNDTAEASPFGRFAANLLVSDNVLDTGKKTKSTGGRSYQNTNEMYSGGWAYDEEGTGENPGKGDEGDFSRYYSLDEWWKHRMSRLPEEVRNTFPFLIVPKASKSEKNMGLDNLEKKQKIYNGQSPEPSNDMKGVEKKFTTLPTQNIHPTVKPMQLFSYLVTLGSRKDDVVLDPFMGSGTTPIACVTLDRKYLGIEREEEYFKIAEARVEKAKNPANLVKHEFF